MLNNELAKAQKYEEIVYSNEEFHKKKKGFFSTFNVNIEASY